MNTSNKTKVWDPFVRVFHWGLVLAFFIAYFTEEDILWLHAQAGYVIIGLLSLRLVWGFIGSRHARFSDFTYSLSNIKEFITKTLAMRAKRYMGHNPAGGAMIFLLLISLILTSFTGIAIYAIAEQSGPLGGILTSNSEFLNDAFEESHEFFANFTLFLVFIHVAGVLIESLIHHENLVKSMVTGYKRSLGNNTGSQS